jgi:hypothetical protein
MLEILCSGHVEATIFTLMLRPRGANNFLALQPVMKMNSYMTWEQ